MHIRMITDHRILIIAGFVSVWSLFSCQDKIEPIDTSDFGYDYFPVRVGSYKIYQSDSIVLSSAGTIRDTFHSYLKEEVDHFFINEGGDSIYVVKVYFKRLESDTFVYSKSVFVTKNKNKVTRQEDNLVFTKLVFPIAAGARFDHNQYFDSEIDLEIGGELFLSFYDDWNTRYEKTDEILSWDGNPYKSVIVRAVDDERTTLDKKFYYETYLEGVGLYTQDMVFLQDSKGGSTPIDQRATKGFYHKRKLLSYQP